MSPLRKIRLRFFAVGSVLLGTAFLGGAEVRETPTGVWAEIYSSDLSTYAANLRAAGVPQATIGVLVSQEINARFTEREQALEPSLSSLQTLKEGWSTARREALLQLKREKNELLRAALEAVPSETAKIEPIPPTLAAATAEQREMVRLIMEDYDAMTARLNHESHGYLLEEDREKLRYLETAVDEDLAKLLSPELALDYQIERDGSMRAMRQKLELFKPTRQELRDIYLARRKTGLDIERRGRTSNLPWERQHAVHVELAKRWGVERWTQYSRQASSQYVELYHFVHRLVLPAAVADQLFDSRQAAYQKTWDVFQGMREKRIAFVPGQPPPIMPHEVSKQSVAEHIKLAKRLLGEAGYREYYNLNNSWIDVMTDGGIPSPEIFERFLPI